MKILERPLYVVKGPIFSTLDNFDYSTGSHIRLCQESAGL